MKLRLPLAAAVPVLTFIFAACHSAPKKAESAAPEKANAAAVATVTATPTPPPVPAPPKPVVDEEAMDKTVSPCDDFYQYACGNWIKHTTPPKDRAMWARGFTEIAERNLRVLYKLLEDYSNGASKPKNKFSKKLGDFYATCMNESSVEKSATADLAAQLKTIDDLKTNADVQKILPALQLKGVSAFFGIGPEIDFKNPKLMIFSVDQGGMGLPDRDYYLKDDENMKKIRAAYVAHVAAMLKLSGIDAVSADKQASAVLALETKMANAAMSRLDRRKPENVYHRIELKGLKERAPHVDWAAFMKGIGYRTFQQIDVNDPDFVAESDKLVTEEPVENIKAYLRYHLITALTPALSKAFVDEDFAFYGKTLSGQEEISPRWKRCIGATDGMLGFALGQAFADQTFGADGKRDSKKNIETIEKTFGDNLKDLSWMDAKTKKAAFAKLKTLFNKVGYPDKMRDYSSMRLSRDSYLKNYLAGMDFNFKYQMNKIGKPVDKKEWGMTPPTVNAYYDAQFNEMVFPAGILQAPFYFRDGTPAFNFGAIGVVMGHELTHGFDDQGRKYDAQGRLENWWTKESTKEFEDRISCVSDQYDKYTLQNSHVNGKLTLGENIADQGGIKLAYTAWKKNGDPKDAQKFFLAFAQSWCAIVKPELERMKLVVDVHSPPRYRVNGAVSSVPGFQEAFQCKAGSPMAPEKRCSIW